MARFPCQGRDDLYDGIRQAMHWERWLHPSMTFRVDVTGSTPGLNHSHYSALQVKNALVDQQRDLWGERSSVDLEDPDLSLQVHLGRGDAVLSLDGSGGSLHRRGYRASMGAAPLKENLAAGLIRLTGWVTASPSAAEISGRSLFPKPGAWWCAIPLTASASVSETTWKLSTATWEEPSRPRPQAGMPGC